MESKGRSAEYKDNAFVDSSSSGLLGDLVSYFSRLNVPTDLAEVYIKTLQILNIPDEKTLKVALIIRLLIGIGRGSTRHARIAQTLYSVFVKNYHTDLYHHGPALALERTQDNLILDSLLAIVAATGTSRYAS